MRVVVATLSLAFGLGAAAAADVKGSADHPLVPRYDGAEIVRFEKESFTEYGLRVDKTAASNPAAALSLEGALTRLTYRPPAERSVLEVSRNYEKALADAGFKTLFACAKADCGDIPRTIESGYLSTVLWGEGDHRYLSASLSRSEGDVYVSLYVTRNGSGGPSRGRAMVQLDIVEVKPMEDRMMIVEASAMQRDLAAEGRVTVYGILFDFDKDSMRPDSKPQLDEIGKLLAASPGLEVFIVGHTDGKGGHEYNLDLSQRRARAIVEALVRDHRIDRGRLMPVGVGMVAPVASNRNEEGRARNRRVELVER